MSKLNIKDNISFVNNQLDGIGFEKHFHEEYSISLVHHGEHFFSVSENKYKINQGFIRNINPYQIHATFESSWSYVNLMPTIDLMQSIAAEMSVKSLKVNAIAFKPIIVDRLTTRLFQNAYYHLNAKGDKFALESSVIELFSHMIKQHSFNEIVEESMQIKVSDKINRALNYMNEYCLDGDISLEEVARVTALNKYYFIREFKRQYGITPIYYLNIKRINKAKEMLLAGTPLCDIAYDCGFNDQAYFTNVFRKFFGYSPGKLGQHLIEVN